MFSSLYPLTLSLLRHCVESHELTLNFVFFFYCFFQPAVIPRCLFLCDTPPACSCERVKRQLLFFSFSAVLAVALIGES